MVIDQIIQFSLFDKKGIKTENNGGNNDVQGIHAWDHAD